MAQINHAIGSRAFELIRNQIGAILAYELPNQATLNNDDRLNAEVFVERFVPIGDEEVPLVIVGFSDVVPGLKTASSTDGEMTFLIDCYEKAKSTTDDPQADKTAAIRLQRLIGVIHGILSHSRYRTLGFAPPFIEHTEVKEIKMAAPKDAKDASSVVMARIEFIVRAPDKNIPIDPVVLDGYTTQALLGLTALGYTYGNYQGQPVSPVCADVQIELNGISIVSAESGATVDIPVVDSNGLVVGAWNGTNFVVPAGGNGTEIIKDSAGLVLYTDIIPGGSTNNRTIVDGVNTLNGGAISGILAEGTKAITLKDPTGATVIPTINTDSATNLDLEIPASVNNYNVYKSGAITSLFTNDDGDIQMGNGTDFLTLTANNYFGNLDKFTDRNGAQVYPDGIVLDWSTQQLNGDVLAYQKTPEPSSSGQLNQILALTPATRDGFSGWYVANARQMTNLIQWGGNDEFFNYAPFNYTMSGNNNSRLWTSTRRSGNVYVVILTGTISRTNYFSAYGAFLVRKFNISEL